MVGKILQRLAKKQKITILCTIHQPRYALATMFDKLYFLAKGNEVYFGSSIPKCLTFFTNAGYTCPEYDNPADFLLDLVNTSLDNHSSPRNSEIQSNNAVYTEIQIDDNAPNADSQKAVNMMVSVASGQKSRDEVIEHLVSEYKKSEFRQNALRFDVSEENNGDKIFNTVDQAFYITPWYVHAHSLHLKINIHLHFVHYTLNETVTINFEWYLHDHCCINCVNRLHL